MNSGKWVENWTKEGRKQLESEPALFSSTHRENELMIYGEFHFRQAVCTMERGRSSRFFTDIEPFGFLAHLSDVDDLSGHLLSISFSSFFEVLAWEEAPMESLAAREGSSQLRGDELRWPLLVGGGGRSQSFIFCWLCLPLDKLAPLDLLFGLKAACSFGPAMEDSAQRFLLFSRSLWIVRNQRCRHH